MKDEALKLALEAWQTSVYGSESHHKAMLLAMTNMAQAIAAQPEPVQPDWKAEYLKSVESGCITLDELRETRAELDATNRQVEILSDALAESRREVAALKAVQEPVRGWWAHTSPITGSTDVQDWQLTEGDKARGWIEREIYTTPPAAQPAVPLTDEKKGNV